MAKIEKKMSAEELDKLVKSFVEKKKKSPSRIDRPLTYKLYNNFFNSNQRDVNACTCLDRDTDAKVVRYIEETYKYEEPLPISSNVTIDFSSFTEPKPKRARKQVTKKDI
jgi:hypothetical protein